MLARFEDRNSVCPSVCLFVRLSVRLSHACIVTKWKKILLKFWYRMVITLVFWYQKTSVGDVPLHLKFALKVTHPRRLLPISAYNVTTVKGSEKCSIIANRSRRRTFQRAIDEVRTLPLTPPKGGSKSEFVVFVNKIQVQSNKVCYIVSLRENFQRQSCSRTIPLYNGV